MSDHGSSRGAWAERECAGWSAAGMLTTTPTRRHLAGASTHLARAIPLAQPGRDAPRHVVALGLHAARSRAGGVSHRMVPGGARAGDTEGQWAWASKRKGDVHQRRETDLSAGGGEADKQEGRRRR